MKVVGTRLDPRGNDCSVLFASYEFLGSLVFSPGKSGGSEPLAPSLDVPSSQLVPRSLYNGRIHLVGSYARTIRVSGYLTV